MPALLIRERVSDYAWWRRAFTEQAYARIANGCLQEQVFRNPDDPSELIVILTWDSLVRARLFSQSDDLLESMGRGDGTPRPEIWLLEETAEYP